LVNSAAGPLSGDEIDFELTVADGARAELVSAGASIAQGRPGAAPGRVRSRALVADGGSLAAESSPLIVCDGAKVEVEVSIQLTGSASVRWQELLVLGRFDEPAGSALIRWQVTREGRPVLRQTVDLMDATAASWPGMLGRHRVLATCLISEPGRTLTGRVDSATAVRQRINDHTVLATVLDDDAASALKRLADLLL
jgi:urease accessory protein